MESKPEALEAPKVQPRWHVNVTKGLAILNVGGIVAVLIYVTRRNTFLPNTPMRSTWWPWSSSFDEVCKCGSHFLLDEYSFTHYNHGFYLFPLVILPVKFLTRRCGAVFDPTSFDWLGFNICLFLESAWEGLENSEYMINQFKDQYPEYDGDTGINIVGDLLVCMTAFVTVELILNYSYRRFGFKVYLTAIALHMLAAEGVFFILRCDGLIMIMMTLTGLVDIPLCGPNYHYTCLMLLWLICVVGWATPCVLARATNRAKEDEKEGIATELVAAS